MNQKEKIEKTKEILRESFPTLITDVHNAALPIDVSIYLPFCVTVDFGFDEDVDEKKIKERILEAFEDIKKHIDEKIEEVKKV